MRAEEFDKASVEELQALADKCFDLAQSPREEPLPMHPDGMSGTAYYLSDEAKLRLLLEAQFYVAAVVRKRDEKVARRDFWLEVAVIILIGIEIVLSVAGIGIGIHEANQQSVVLSNIQKSTKDSATAMSAASTSLQFIANEQTASRNALIEMNADLQQSLKLSGSMTSAIQTEAKIVQDQQAKSLAEAARKPQLQLYIGSVLLNSASNTDLKPREETDTSAAFDVSFRNWGNKTATAPLLRIVTTDKDIMVQSSNRRVTQPELPPDAPGLVNLLQFLLQFDNMRAGITLSFELTISYSKGHRPFNVIFSCDADEIQTGTPLGSIQVTPRRTIN
jgi:hypothetical protein